MLDIQIAAETTRAMGRRTGSASFGSLLQQPEARLEDDSMLDNAAREGDQG